MQISNPMERKVLRKTPPSSKNTFLPYQMTDSAKRLSFCSPSTTPYSTLRQRRKSFNWRKRTSSSRQTRRRISHSRGRRTNSITTTGRENSNIGTHKSQNNQRCKTINARISRFYSTNKQLLPLHTRKHVQTLCAYIYGGTGVVKTTNLKRVLNYFYKEHNSDHYYKLSGLRNFFTDIISTTYSPSMVL